MKLVWGTVVAVDSARDDLQKLTVELDTGEAGTALNYPALAGICAEGDRVLLNTTAVELGLGTGGSHFVVARQGSDGIALDAPSGGHIMKLRYTPLQLDVMAVEAPESPSHEIMAAADSLDGMPVVCCGLHSQVPLVAAAVKRARPDARVAYCATDGAALPLALSEVIVASCAASLIDTTITCGQAFGGELEAVNLHSGLLAARHVAGADVAIVAIGPGVAGTSTPFGHGGVAQGEAINAVASLGGQPVACLRVSFADARERHRGVSHHTLAALTKVALAPAIVAVPTLSAEYSDAIAEGLLKAGVEARHTLVTSPEGTVDAPPMQGVRVTTMGRGSADDPAFFAAAFAAGEIASRIHP
ncbi:MAG TPA: DUF3866 family protein [Coriobacteriia bacterium]|nr:DUF3866 family protein [Coriobacteriia bacterium]